MIFTARARKRFPFVSVSIRSESDSAGVWGDRAVVTDIIYSHPYCLTRTPDMTIFKNTRGRASDAA